MPRVRYLLLILLLFTGRASAVLPTGVSFAGSKTCNSYKHAVNVSGGTTTCVMSNVVAGDTLLLGINFVNATTFTITGTETPTCPSQLQNLNTVGGFGHAVQVCYLVLASSHASFQITVTINTGGVTRQVAMLMEEYAGLGAVDTGSRTAVNLLTTNFTTAANNEFAWSFVDDLSNDLAPGGANKQMGMMHVAPSGTQGYREMSMTQVTGNAGTYTSSFTSSGSFSSGAVAFDVVVAFAIAGGHPQAAVYTNQYGNYIHADSGTAAQGVEFNGTLNGSKLVVFYTATTTNTSHACQISTGESCTCPASAFVTHSYSAINYAQALCYSDMTSAHAGLVTFSIQDLSSVATFQSIHGEEKVGLVSGADTASAAAAAALTVNYTTLASGEYTVCGATDGMTTFPPNLMTPGNSFNTVSTSYADGPGSGSGELVYIEGLVMDITTSGTSGTCSYTMTSSSVPMISVLAFAPTPVSGYRNHSSIM